MTIIKNTCVYIFNKHGYLLMLKCSFSKQWMTAGGAIEPHETPLNGMKREFKEETNHCFPTHCCTFFETLQWKDTLVYLVMVNHRFPSVFEKTNETTAMRFIHYSKILLMNNIKQYVKKSFLELNLQSRMEQILGR
jgi:8-oxo-dGTP pyrophosphatase MutT (NUDIX family)